MKPKVIHASALLVTAVGLLLGGYMLSAQACAPASPVAALGTAQGSAVASPGSSTTGNLPTSSASVPSRTATGQMVAASIVYSQPPNPAGGLYPSSWWDPNGSDYDQYVWDNFTLPAARFIAEIHWRGGYDPTKAGSGGPVLTFTVGIYASIPGGTQPNIVSPPLVEYHVPGNAGETAAGTFGGVGMYDYSFTLPAPFEAAAGVTYWLQIEATQHGIPDWGIAVGTGGNLHYFRRIANGGDWFYQIVPGDAAFTLIGPPRGSYRTYFPIAEK